ncbi:hypothetical protein ACIF6L_31820 [Kitasatospora sp. NPDC086009]|uniref:hypothetical protein n=1 Tax=unclassified Kitasatospora TaxID=2633591 RepID=UPI0037C51D6B
MSTSASSASNCSAANAGASADSPARYAVISPPAIPTSIPAAVARCAQEARPGMPVLRAGAAGAPGSHQAAAGGGAGIEG